MAYGKQRNYNSRNTKSRNNKKGNSKSRQLTKLAYDLGRIQKGLKNPETRVSYWYDQGLNSQKTKQRRPLY